MPLIESDFTTSFPFTNKHFNTVYRTLFTNPKVNYNRKRIDTTDGDFIDLDFSSVKSKHLAILIHGLEGSSSSKYILSTTNYLNKENIDVVVFNLRGCSGEMNKHYKAYHSGETGDLNFIIEFLISNYNYETISLVGFSLGGNMVLKYAGEQKENSNSIIKAIVAVSVPCDLRGSSLELAKKSNRMYMKRFLKTLVSKALSKHKLFPHENLDTNKMKNAKTFQDFDNLYTAPSFGFKDAEHYWEKASSLPFLAGINVQTYLLFAQDDPFLSKSCYPKEIAPKKDNLTLEISKYGGHIGFIQSFNSKRNNWMEKKITNFIQEKRN